MLLADQISTWSKDPSRGVGAVIVSDDRRICATGYNGLPVGIEDRPERLERPTKYDLICHAEVNAIVQCARNGTSTIGSTLYSSWRAASRLMGTGRWRRTLGSVHCNLTQSAR